MRVIGAVACFLLGSVVKGASNPFGSPKSVQLPPGGATRATKGPAEARKSPLDGSEGVTAPVSGETPSISAVPVPPPPKKDKETVVDVLTFKSRPAVDYGLRYSSNDWFTTFISTPTSFTLRRIKGQLLFQAAVCLAVIYFFPKNPQLAIPMTGHSLLAASLGLLLSYRTNSAYARFWEARGHWTDTKSTCRNLALMVKAHVEPHSPKAAKHFLKLLAAYPSTLMFLCLGGAIKLPDDTLQFLSAKNAEEYKEAPALPAMDLCLQMHQTLHAAVLESKTANVDLVEAAHLNEIAHMVDSLMVKASSCEKILRTPLPWTYSRHTSRFLTLWIGTLPFALIGQLSPKLTFATVMAMSYCMLGIEEVGHLVEQPFLGDPLTGDDQIWSLVDKDGEASPLIERGFKTQPYDIGIPVCSLAKQIREEILRVSVMEPAPH